MGNYKWQRYNLIANWRWSEPPITMWNSNTYTHGWNRFYRNKPIWDNVNKKWLPPSNATTFGYGTYVSYGTVGYDIWAGDYTGNGHQGSQLLVHTSTQSATIVQFQEMYCSIAIGNSGNSTDYFYSYSRGSYVGEITSSSPSTYPSDGASGSYWYVYLGYFNTAPTTPGAFLSPTGTLKRGQFYTVSWGSSGDSEGDSITYSLEMQKDSGPWGSIYSLQGTSVSYATPLEGSTIGFRVRAYDGSVYSAYRQSNTFTLEVIPVNRAPTLTLTKEDGSAITNNQTIKFTGKLDFAFNVLAKDDDVGDALKYSVTISGVELTPLSPIQNGVALKRTISFPSLSVGNNTVTVRVQDNLGVYVIQNFVLANINPDSLSQKHVHDLIEGTGIPLNGYGSLQELKPPGYNRSTISLTELVDHLK